MSKTSATPLEALPDQLTDLLYTGVGLGVLAVNKIQVARRQARKTKQYGETADPWSRVQKALSQPGAAKDLLSRLHQELQSADDRTEGIETKVNELLDRIEPDLPSGAQELVSALRDLTADHAAQARAVLGLRARD